MLLHHVMGELEGIRGAWGYPEGGMGAVSGAIAKSALAAGAEVFTDKQERQERLNVIIDIIRSKLSDTKNENNNMSYSTFCI